MVGRARGRCGTRRLWVTEARASPSICCQRGKVSTGSVPMRDSPASVAQVTDFGKLNERHRILKTPPTSIDETLKMKTRLFALAALAALGSGSALAQQAGDWQVGAGWLHFAPRDSSEPLTFTAPRPAIVPGSGASVDSSDTLGLNAQYFIDSNWAVEGVIGVPPKFKLQGTGTLGPIGELGEASQWSPTLLAKYYFLEGDAKLRPFVGVGATYVWYSDVKLTPGLQGALASRVGIPAGRS